MHVVVRGWQIEAQTPAVHIGGKATSGLAGLCAAGRSSLFTGKRRVREDRSGRNTHSTGLGHTLTTEEFIRRFLLHLLPGGFHHIMAAPMTNSIDGEQFV